MTGCEEAGYAVAGAAVEDAGGLQGGGVGHTDWELAEGVDG